MGQCASVGHGLGTASFGIRGHSRAKKRPKVVDSCRLRRAAANRGYADLDSGKLPVGSNLA